MEPSDTALPPDLNVTTGWEIATLAANVTVTTSPGLACVAGELSEVILALVRVGAVLSNVTLPLPVVTAVPGFPARSPTTIL